MGGSDVAPPPQKRKQCSMTALFNLCLLKYIILMVTGEKQQMCGITEANGGLKTHDGSTF